MFYKSEYEAMHNAAPIVIYNVNPTTGTKVCQVCDTDKFTVEFADIPEAIDGKLPVCTECYKSRSKSDWASTMVDSANIARECRKCRSTKSITAFSYHKSKNNFSDTCQKCTPAAPKFWQGHDGK